MFDFSIPTQGMKQAYQQVQQATEEVAQYQPRWGVPNFSGQPVADTFERQSNTSAVQPIGSNGVSFFSSLVNLAKADTLFNVNLGIFRTMREMFHQFLDLLNPTAR